jgi:hypothetical protein
MSFREEELLKFGCLMVIPMCAAVALNIWAWKRKSWKWYWEGIISFVLLILSLSAIPPFATIWIGHTQ